MAILLRMLNYKLVGCHLWSWTGKLELVSRTCVVFHNHQKRRVWFFISAAFPNVGCTYHQRFEPWAVGSPERASCHRKSCHAPSMSSEGFSVPYLTQSWWPTHFSDLFFSLSEQKWKRIEGGKVLRTTGNFIFFSSSHRNPVLGFARLDALFCRDVLL